MSLIFYNICLVSLITTYSDSLGLYVSLLFAFLRIFFAERRSPTSQIIKLLQTLSYIKTITLYTIQAINKQLSIRN